MEKDVMGAASRVINEADGNFARHGKRIETNVIGLRDVFARLSASAEDAIFWNLKKTTQLAGPQNQHF